MVGKVSYDHKAVSDEKMHLQSIDDKIIGQCHFLIVKFVGCTMKLFALEFQLRGLRDKVAANSQCLASMIQAMVQVGPRIEGHHEKSRSVGDT